LGTDNKPKSRRLLIAIAQKTKRTRASVFAEINSIDKSHTARPPELIESTDSTIGTVGGKSIEDTLSIIEKFTDINAIS
jgi:hypothetical protein